MASCQQGNSSAEQRRLKQHDCSSNNARTRVLQLLEAGRWCDCMAVLLQLRTQAGGTLSHTTTPGNALALPFPPLPAASSSPHQQQSVPQAEATTHQHLQRSGQPANGSGDGAAPQSDGQGHFSTAEDGAAQQNDGNGKAVGVSDKPLPDGGHSNCGTDGAWVYSREATQAWVIAGLHVHAEAGAWALALQLEPTHTNKAVAAGVAAEGIAPAVGGIAQPSRDIEAAAVRRAHRRIAGLVHPDKCCLAHAHHAFQLASLARTRLLDTLIGGDTAHGEVWEGGDGDGAGEEEGYNWWDAWDTAQQQSSAWAVAETAAAQAIAAAKDEEHKLWQMPLQELRRLVQQQQAGLFTPSQPGQPNIHMKRRQLKQARSVLASRMAGRQQQQHDGVAGHPANGDMQTMRMNNAAVQHATGHGDFNTQPHSVVHNAACHSTQSIPDKKLQLDTSAVNINGGLDGGGDGGSDDGPGLRHSIAEDMVPSYKRARVYDADTQPNMGTAQPPYHGMQQDKQAGGFLKGL